MRYTRELQMLRLKGVKRKINNCNVPIAEVRSYHYAWDKKTTWNRTPIRGNWIRVCRSNGFINTYIPRKPKGTYIKKKLMSYTITTDIHEFVTKALFE